MKALDRAALVLIDQANADPVRPRRPIAREARTASFMVIRSSAQETARDAALAHSWLAYGVWIGMTMERAGAARQHWWAVFKGVVAGGAVGIGLVEAGLLLTMFGWRS